MAILFVSNVFLFELNTIKVYRVEKLYIIMVIQKNIYLVNVELCAY